MSWILTHRGRRVDPLRARPEDLELADIAHALSLLCRFNGHCRQFYSVAEHSVRVSQVLPAAHAAWGLMHDAAEAYLSDLPRPIKQQLPAFNAMEATLQQVVARRFGLVWPLPQPVHEADDRLLVTELRDLMPACDDAALPGIAPLAEPLEPWSASRAERAFLERAEELGLGLGPASA